MACSQTLAGLAYDCAPSVGGIKAIYLANYVDVTSVTVTSDKISAITMASGKKFKKYDLIPETAHFESALQINPANGSNYVQTDIFMQFNKMETVKRVEISAIVAAHCACVVEDENGAYWYFGKNRAVMPSGANGMTGTAHGDRNGFDVTMQAKDDTFAFELTSGTVIENLL